MKRFDPKYYINDTDSKDNPRVNQIISKCEDAGAKSKTKDEAADVVKGLPANKRYELGKQTLYIKELKRSFVHFFNTPRGSLESPQLIINHGMICPHSCQYCYWQKDVFQSSRIVVFANPKERFKTDIKNAMAIWRVFSALLKIPACSDKVNDKTFSQFDKRIKNEKEKAADTDLNEVCYNLAEKMLSKWGVQDADIQFFKGLFEDQNYSPKVIFNSGENNDSVAHEHITDVQKNILIPTVFSLDNAYLMLRTKSIHYDFLEQFKDHEKKDRIIISPSLIPQEFIEKYESGNYSLEERLKTLKKVSDWGFKIFPCFSPLFYTGKSWGKIIEDFIKVFNEYLPPDKIQYYTLGTLRLSKTAIRNIRLIHPDTDLASSYLVKPKHTSGDKFRYPKIIRIKMYAFFIRTMNGYGYVKIPRFLQTETIEAWKALTTDKYSELGLDLQKYLSGELDIEALTGIERARGKGKGAKANKANKRFKSWEKAKIKTDDGLEKEAIATPLTSESRVSDYTK